MAVALDEAPRTAGGCDYDRDTHGVTVAAPAHAEVLGSHCKHLHALQRAAVKGSMIQEMGWLKELLHKQVSDSADGLKGYLQCCTKGI